jgi:hypothetical protein
VSKPSTHFINDAGIADLLGMSRSWVRKERFNRRHGLSHFFDVDPIYIGSAPRYRVKDVIHWCKNQGQSSARQGEI